MRNRYYSAILFLYLLCIVVLAGCSKDEVDDNDKIKPETGAVLDLEGNVYLTVRIGGQWWMAENLRTAIYNDGSEIAHPESDNDWIAATGGAWVYYDNDSELVQTYGSLYNWYTVIDERGLCPDGWRVPSDEDWQELEIYLGMSRETASLKGLRGDAEGGMLKETGVVYWETPNVGATNETWFNALPAGSRQTEPLPFFGFIGEDAYFWTSTPVDENYAWSRSLTFKTAGIIRLESRKGLGYSVRCLEKP